LISPSLETKSPTEVVKDDSSVEAKEEEPEQIVETPPAKEVEPQQKEVM
jgi:hypothetical protein